MTEWRPKLRADVHARVVSPHLAVLDTGSGVELLEGCLAFALPHLLKEEPWQEIIDHAGASRTLDIVYAIEELSRRDLLADGKAGAGAAPSIVFVGDYLDPRLEEKNGRALAEGRPWMLARPRGRVVWAGPVFVPGRGPCWACMAARLRAVRAAWRLPERHHDDSRSTRIGLDLAALEAARWKRQPDSAARLLTFDTRSLVHQAHVIARRRDCPACGDPAAHTPFTPLVLQSRRKTFTLDGGHRAVPPEETAARYEHLVSPLTGIVHHVAREAGDAGTLNVFVARHNFAVGDDPAPDNSHGKGMTAAEARTGALCEALERYSGIFHGTERLVRAAFRDLDEDAVHPHACLGISERQYRERQAWNAGGQRHVWIPEPFDEGRETDWAPAWSLTHERKRHLAAALCFYGYRSEGNDFAHADSNGAAAGTCPEDAILQGLLELVERDAAGIWWYGRIRRPSLKAETPFVRNMTHEHAARGRRLWLLDLTTDLGIPVCAAVSVGADPDSLHLGFGAHLDPAIAVTRAITEANQVLGSGRKSCVYGAELPDRTFLEPHGVREPATEIMPSDDLRTDVLACVEVLRQRGLEVIVLDQTRDDVGLPVMKVFVPGLRHFRPRFAPGRLYDVPLRLGWSERPLREDELNPSHLVI